MLHSENAATKLEEGPVSETLRSVPASALLLIEEDLGIGYWEISAKAGGVLLSKTACQILNPEADGRSMPLDYFLARFAAEDAIILARAIENAVDLNVGFNITLKTSARRNPRHARMACRPVAAPNGRPTALSGVVQDVTEHVKEQAVSKGRAAVLRSVMKHIPASVLVVDKNMTILSASDHWKTTRGLTATAQVLGKGLYDVLPFSKQNKAQHQRALAGEVVRSVREMTKPDGTRDTQSVVMTPWRGAKGELGGLIIMVGQIDPMAAGHTSLPDKAEPESLFDLLATIN